MVFYYLYNERIMMETKKFYMNKLVRDKSIKNLEKNGCTHVQWHALDDTEEYLGALAEKMVEELEEVFDAESREEMIEELADIEEVLVAFKELVEIKQSEVDAARKKKRDEKGTFEGRYFIEYVEAKVGSPAYQYALEKEEKYPEMEFDTDEDEE
jgi:predicted house-cleaning noncanonical NTP pyrophosphatase (MazG superfamily)